MKAKVNRREFVSTLATATAFAGTLAESSLGQAREADLTSQNATEVPDTLDLAERAGVAINGLTRILDPHHRYMNHHIVDFYADPPFMSHNDLGRMVCWSGNELWGKGVEALLKMRIASGSKQNIERDPETTEGMISCIGPDNLYRKRVAVIEGGEAVRTPADDNASLYGQARVMLALLYLYQLEGDPRWLEVARRAGKGLTSVAMYKGDYAYYPFSDEGGALNMPLKGWKSTAEPAGWDMCEKGWYFSSANVEFSQGGIVRAFCLLHKLTGDEEALEFAGKLVRFMMKPRMWAPEGEAEAVVSKQHAHFSGHIHAYCWGLWGILDFAVLTQDSRLKAFVRDGYEYIRNFGISRVGLFGEGCGVGDMTNLAIRLSETGAGDYWEDVDQYVRNQLVEIQLLKPELVERIVKSSPTKSAVGSWETTRDVVARNVGTLFSDDTHPASATPGGCYCCTYNGLIGYYHAWKSIVGYDGGVARVNLLLNRRSEWVDVESYLPYEGKVVIRNKAAKSIIVRMPNWVEARGVKSVVNGEMAKPIWAGRYMVFREVKPEAVLVVGFPMVESQESYENGFEHAAGIPGHTEVTCLKKEGELTRYRMMFRGSTLVEVSPRQEVNGYPLYERAQLKGDNAPMKAKSPYVASKLV